MKKVLIVLSVLICNYGYGQDSTITYGIKTSDYIGKYCSYDSIYGIFKSARSSDTVKVIMLVCDTFNRLKYYSKATLSIDISYAQPIYWIIGYEVVKKVPYTYESWTSHLVTSIIDIIYLDDKMKPLSKNIIVWQTKNR